MLDSCGKVSDLFSRGMRKIDHLEQTQLLEKLRMFSNLHFSMHIKWGEFWVLAGQ